MCEGYNLKFKLEYNMQLSEMRLMRWVGSLIYNTNVKRGQTKEPEKLYPLQELDNEESENAAQPTKADWERIKKEFK